MSEIHVNRDGRRIGPLSVDEINWKLETGEIATTDLACIEGMPEWKPLADETFLAVGVEMPDGDEEEVDEVGEEMGEAAPDAPAVEEAPVAPEAPAVEEAPPPPAPEVQMAEQAGGTGGEIQEEAGRASSGVEAPEKGRSAFLIHLWLIDFSLRCAKNLFSAKRLEAMDVASRRTGLLATACGALAMLVFGIVRSIKTEEAEPALYHALALPGVIIAQFIAVKFLGAGRKLIDKSPGQVSSKAFLECFALLLMLGAAGAFGWGAYTSIKAGEFHSVAAGFGLAVVLLYAVGATLNHETVNVRLEEETSVGDEAIGLFSFFVKLHMRLVPFVFGVVAALAFVGMIYSLIRLMGAEGNESALHLQGNYEYFTYMIQALFLPFTAYVAFLACYLVIDLVRAILCLLQFREK